MLIGGFIVKGPTGSTKKVLIRALGPTLANFGIANFEPDPFLTLHFDDGTTATNDNWRVGPYTSQIPTGFQPGDDREAVIVATLPPGNYSAVVEGAHGETGVGLAEVYELDTSSLAQLANLSTRGVVGADDAAMIGGFIASGTSSTKVVLRAIGPSLAPFLTGALPDPTLSLVNANGTVADTNNDWQTSPQATEISDLGLAPRDSKESAISTLLAPGNYTAIVRGVNGATGIGLVECYRISP